MSQDHEFNVISLQMCVHEESVLDEYYVAHLDMPIEIAALFSERSRYLQSEIVKFQRLVSGQ